MKHHRCKIFLHQSERRRQTSGAMRAPAACRTQGRLSPSDNLPPQKPYRSLRLWRIVLGSLAALVMFFFFSGLAFGSSVLTPPLAKQAVCLEYTYQVQLANIDRRCRRSTTSSTAISVPPAPSRRNPTLCYIRKRFSAPTAVWKPMYKSAHLNQF